MTPFGSLNQYPEGSLVTAEAALLTVWRSLEIYHPHLVLIGGLAVRYLTQAISDLPGTVTMDVDFGLALAADESRYDTLGDRLRGLGFIQEHNRFRKMENGIPIYVDLLTEAPGYPHPATQVTGVIASNIPGINRALECHRTQTIHGRDLFGAEHTCTLRVVDIGPLLVLKLNAFGGPNARRAGKDAYDILLAVTAFVDGYNAALAGFKAEKTASNTAMEHALACLQNDFTEENHDGPLRAAEFRGGTEAERQRVRQDMVTVGRALLHA